MAVPPNKVPPKAPPPGMKGAPPAGDKGGPPPAAGKPLPPKPGAEPEDGPPPGGKPDMPPGKSTPTDAKTPAKGPGGPQPPGKGEPPPGPPPGPELGPSDTLQEAQNLLDQYVRELMQGNVPGDPNIGNDLLNMPEGPDPIPDKMSSLIPKGTGNQRIGTIPAPNLPTGQGMPMQRSANPGVQLVGGLPLNQVQGYMDVGKEGGPGGQGPEAPPKKPPPG